MALGPGQGASPGSGPERRVVLGRVHGPFGVRGWVKLRSYTDPPEAILEYDVWRLQLPGGERALKTLEGRRHGDGLVIRFEGIADRDAAELLGGHDVAVLRSEMPAPAPGEYYWEDLIGQDVEHVDGRPLGRLDHIVDAPANPVMVVMGERERWIPLVPQHLKTVDLDAGRIVVDWVPEF